MKSVCDTNFEVERPEVALKLGFRKIVEFCWIYYA